MDPREELLQIQKTISYNIKESIKSYQGRQSPRFKRYLGVYKREFKNFRHKITKTDLINRIIKADLVFIGDYHTLDQSQKTVIKILREIITKKTEITLVLEVVNRDNQMHIDDFMAGNITEGEFLEKIDYSKNWGFPWANYKPIFDFAKIHGLRVAAANSETGGDPDSLVKKDHCAAEVILREIKKNPSNLVLVFFGDLHVAEKHLPRNTSRLLKGAGFKKDYIIVFQNNEDLYWRLATQRREHSADVVKLASRKFCILNTPPWIKLQTYLNWLEQGGDLLLAPSDAWPGEDADSLDYFHQITNLTLTISDFLEFRQTELNFHIYSTDDIEFLDFINRYMKSKDDLSMKEIDIIREEIIFDGICLMPDERVIYLSNLSINKVSEKAAQLVAFKESGYYPRLEREGDREFFYSRILTETIGFLGSKIINFKRKSDRVKDYKNILKALKGKRSKGRLKDQKTIAKFVVEHKNYEQKVLRAKNKKHIGFKKSIYQQSSRIFLGLTKALGSIIGSKLFLALIKGQTDKAYLKRLFTFKPRRNGDSFGKYMELVSSTRGVKEMYASKKERF